MSSREILADLLRRVDRVPFRPFEVELTSGSKVKINHPENVFFIPARPHVDEILVWEPKGGCVFDPEAVVRIFWRGRNGASSN